MAANQTLELRTGARSSPCGGYIPNALDPRQRHDRETLSGGADAANRRCKRVLIACEFSGTVRDAFIKRGLTAESRLAGVTGYPKEAHQTGSGEAALTFHPAFLTGDSQQEREPEDYYKTPTHATLALLERETFDGIVWEPACGDGAIARLLKGEVIATDLHNRGFGESGMDFLRVTKAVNHVVTNPPYKLAQAFVEHALECASEKVAMLLKLNFLEGQRRKPFWMRTPLRRVYVFSARLSFDKGDVKGKGSGLLAYAWYVWERGYKGAPEIQWI